MAPSDRSAYPCVLLKISPEARERPLLLEGRTHVRVLEQVHHLKGGPISRRRGRRWVREQERIALEIQHT
jgi:hypothetical protein